MLSVAIIGGKLQGIEAVYLARKAGFKSLLVDRNAKAPASGFCDAMGVFDVVKKERALIDFLKEADFILPALENDAALAALLDMAQDQGFALAFDPQAYAITSSKLRSDRLMAAHGVPLPQVFPGGGGPYILKPSEKSGSAGVYKAQTAEEVRRFLAEVGDSENWVAQEYLEGPSYSIEVVGRPGLYRTYEITEIHVDEIYDCRMVTAPCGLPVSKEKELADIAKTIANLVGLRGIMDVEVIDHGGVLKVLEIDARLPSQTPMVVYHCTGVNLLAELAELTLESVKGFACTVSTGGSVGACRSGRLSPLKNPKREKQPRTTASMAHYLIGDGAVRQMGERIMSAGAPLVYQTHFFGADEALSDYDGSRTPWRGAFIHTGKSEAEVAEKRAATERALVTGSSSLEAGPSRAKNRLRR